jgi:hypothetical protein
VEVRRDRRGPPRGKAIPGKPPDLAGVLTCLAAAAKESASPAAGEARALENAARMASGGARTDQVVSFVDCLPESPDSVRTEIAALVGAATPWPAQVPNASADHLPTMPPGATRRFTWRSALRPVWRSLAALIALAAAVLLEFSVLHDRIVSDLHVLASGTKPASSSAPPASPRVPAGAVPAVAAAFSGAVSGVDLRALGTCSPGTSCSVRVLVHLVSGSGAGELSWTFQIVDRCAGTRSTASGGDVSIAPGISDVTAVDNVPLPPGRALAVIAQTELPARAASAPVLVGGDSC